MWRLWRTPPLVVGIGNEGDPLAVCHEPASADQSTSGLQYPTGKKTVSLDLLPCDSDIHHSLLSHVGPSGYHTGPKYHTRFVAWPVSAAVRWLVPLSPFKLQLVQVPPDHRSLRSSADRPIGPELGTKSHPKSHPIVLGERAARAAG